MVGGGVGVGGGEDCSGGKWVCWWGIWCASRKEYDTWTTPLSGFLWQLSQPRASAQPQGKKQFSCTSYPHTHTHTQSYRITLHNYTQSCLASFQWRLGVSLILCGISLPTTLLFIHIQTQFLLLFFLLNIEQLYLWNRWLHQQQTQIQRFPLVAAALPVFH